MKWLGSLGCACAVSLTVASCNGSGSADSSGSAGSHAAAGSPGEAGSSGEGGSADAADVSELADWPMPNAPGTGLPNIESYDEATTPGTVHDQVTGLDWQQDPGTALFSRADAIAHCDTLALAGFEDWRAPTFVELVSLFDAAPDISASSEPSYISTVFSIGTRYWASTAPVGTDTTLGRLVDFSANGCSANTMCSIGVSGKKELALGGAFCVRRSAPPKVSSRFEVASDHVHDRFTGLDWITLASAIQTGTYADATARCGALGDSARVPSITELLSILAPVLDVIAFPGWPKALFAWSSSPIPVTVTGGSYWGAADGGASKPFSGGSMARIQCVR